MIGEKDQNERIFLFLEIHLEDSSITSKRIPFDGAKIIMKKITVGNLQSEPGKKVYGYLDILEHPVGTVERLPVIIAQGIKEGPTLWITANIHGDEYTGIPVIHRVINTIDLNKLKGTIVAIPTLNPAGSRVIQRYPYYDKKDPNRLFPDGNPFQEKDNKVISSEVVVSENEENLVNEISIKTESQVKISIDDEKIPDPFAKYEVDNLYPSIQEIIFKRLFAIIKESADYLIDLHNAFLKSIPFVFLDRVLYNSKLGDEAHKEAAELFKQTEAMVKAFGLTIIREALPKKYVTKKLHRSTSGAALNYLRIPSFTVELGMYLDIEPEVVEAATIGIFNVLTWAKMLAGDIKKLTGVRVVAESESVRYIGHPRVTSSAIIDLKVAKGDFVKKGDVIAIARDIFGREIPEVGEIKSEVDGYIFMFNQGIIRYPNEEICWMAVKDTQLMVDKWPKK